MQVKIKKKRGGIMESLKGLLISLVVFFLMVIPFILDTVSMSVAVSQLNKVGAEIIQVVGSSSEYGERTQRAIELAEERYGVKVSIDDTSYELGDTVNLKLEKEILNYFGCVLESEGGNTEQQGDEGCLVKFETEESVMITKRGD